MRHLEQTYQSVYQELNEDSCAGKRKALAALTPQRSSPDTRKLRRIKSPSANSPCRKSLFPGAPANKNDPSGVEMAMLSKLNVDNLDTSHGSKMKVVIGYPAGNVVVRSKFDKETHTVLMNICLSQWQTAVNAIFRHSLLFETLRQGLEREAEREFSAYSKFDSCLKVSDPDQLAAFSNQTLCQEVSVQCPLNSSVVRGACNLEKAQENKKESAVNAIALATSALARAINPSMSAVAYRLSSIIFHSGMNYKDIIRLNHLGVCMSPKRVISLQEKMGNNFDFRVKIWKKSIEEKKSAQLFVDEIKESLLPKREEDYMDVEVEVCLEEDKVNNFKWYSPDVYQHTMTLMNAESRRQLGGISEDVIVKVQKELLNTKLPTYR